MGDRNEMGLFGRCVVAFLVLMLGVVAVSRLCSEGVRAETPRATLDTADSAVVLEAVATMANRGQGTRVAYSQDVAAGEKYVVCLVRVTDFLEQAERDALAPAIESLSPKVDDVELVMECQVPADDLAAVNRAWKYYLSGHIRADRLPEPEPAP